MILNIPFHLGANYEPLDLISWLFNPEYYQDFGYAEHPKKED